MSEQFETTWAAADRTLLDVALAALPPSVSKGPVVTVEWGGTTSYAVRLSTTVAPIGPPPAGIRVEVAPVAGVFMQGPALPTPLEWMDRLSEASQIALLEALEQSSEGRRLKVRLAAAREIDPAHREITGAVAVLRQSGALSEDDANKLLAQR